MNTKPTEQPGRHFRLLTILTVLAASLAPSVQAQFIMTNLWSIATTTGAPYDYISVDSSQRGIAYNPTTNHVYVVSRTGSTTVHVLDGTTGENIGTLDMTGVSGGGGASLNLVDCTEDGQIYICNLATSEATFRLYRYTNEASAPVLVFFGDPTLMDTNAPVTNSKRFGDNLATRGTGTNVQVLVHSRGGRASGLLYPVDDTMNTFTSQTILTDAGNGDMGLGAAFGNGDSFWSKAPARNLRRLVIANPADIYNPSVALVATSAVNIALSPTSTSGLHSLPASNLLAVIDYGGHTLRLFDTSSGTNVVLQDAKAFPAPATANGNGTGEAAFGINNGAICLYGLDSNNGLLATKVVPISSPVIGSGPGATAILEGGYGTISVAANGSAPLYYYWQRTDTNFTTTNLVAVLTNNGTLPFTNVAGSDLGYYSVIVSNSAGTATSPTALLSVLPSVRTPVSAKLWQLLPGSRNYLTVDNTQRGLAFNALSNHVLIANRSGAPSINILDAATGNNVATLDMTGVGGQFGETFPINMVGVAGDGAIYVCNLTTTGGGFTIYRWADENPATLATIAYGPDFAASERIGDTFAVTGSGVDTRLIAATRNGTQVIVFTTFDGVYFSPNIVDAALAPNPAPAGFAGLGLAAGDGDSFWATSGTFLLRKVVYDLLNATNDVVLALAGQTGNNIGVDSANHFVANTGSGDTPSNLRLLDVSDPTQGAVLVDQEFFGSDNANLNFTGAVAFDMTGGRIFALDSNNGIIALKYAPRLNHAGNVLTWTGPGVLQSATDVADPYNDLVGATSPYTHTAGTSLFFRVRR